MQVILRSLYYTHYYIKLIANILLLEKPPRVILLFAEADWPFAFLVSRPSFHSLHNGFICAGLHQRLQWKSAQDIHTNHRLVGREGFSGLLGRGQLHQVC